ncbi:hypothetical protein [Dickeya zeae]|uniref:hypothetical protein n=1 Tax=Dickeya zeae TaxID=204042 RepID=UPI00037C2F1A|nr:hypothetical protein [Dickeya zeae]UJR54992.1 hypothetical protein J417_13635 [Dickeya zeae MS1]
MNEQQIHDIRFELAYSYQLEKMTEVFNRRIDKLLCLIQFFLGSAVVTEHGSGLLLGILIAIISALLFTLKPGEITGSAKQQAQKYRILLDDLDTSDIEIIKQKKHVIEQTDSPHPYSLCGPAYHRAAVMLGLPANSKLTPMEKLFSFFCGGIPL